MGKGEGGRARHDRIEESFRQRFQIDKIIEIAEKLKHMFIHAISSFSHLRRESPLFSHVAEREEGGKYIAVVFPWDASTAHSMSSQHRVRAVTMYLPKPMCLRIVPPCPAEK